MSETIQNLEEGRIYETNMKELVKIINVDKEKDWVHFYNITLAINQQLPLSRIMKHSRITKKIR